MTDREIFEHVKAHLLTQNKKALSRGMYGACVYRTDSGLRCAVGCLITDAAYHPGIEGEHIYNIIPEHNRWVSLLERAEILAGVFNRSNIPARSSTRNLLHRLQHLHDEYEVGEWRTMLDQLEADFFAGQAP